MQHDVNRERRMRGRPPTLIYGKTLAELGITRQQAWAWCRLADIPEDVFEEITASLPRLSLGAVLSQWDMMNQRHHRRLPASLERMAELLRQHGYIVFPPRNRGEA